MLGKNVIDIACGGVHNICLTREQKGFDYMIFDCFKKGQFCDFEVKCLLKDGEQILNCHSIVLCMRSAYFKDIIKNKSQKCVELKTSSVDIAKAVLEYIYTDNIEIFDKFKASKHFVQILKIAQNLSLHELFKNVETRMRQTFKKYLDTLSSVKMTEESSSDKFNGLFFLPNGKPFIIFDDRIVEKILENSMEINFDEHKRPGKQATEGSKIPKYKTRARQTGNTVEKEEKAVEVVKDKPKIDEEIEKFIAERDLYDLSKVDLGYIQFINDKSTSDLEVKIGDKSVFVHKVIACTRSAFFKAREELYEEDECTVIEISNMSYENVLEILLFMYNDNVKLTMERSLNFIEGCDTLMVDSLKSKLEMHLCTLLNTENALKIFKYAYGYNCEKLISICLSFIKENYNEIVETPEIEDLKRELLLQIIRYCKD